METATVTGHTHKSFLLTFLVLFSGHLSQVAEVVSLHLQVEDFAFNLFGIGDQIFFKQVLQVKVSNISVEM